MVCDRCKIAVGSIFKDAGLQPVSVNLGEVELTVAPNGKQLEAIHTALALNGFELINDKKSRITETIKNNIVQLVHYSEEPIASNLSSLLSSRLNYDYTYLSNIFSETEGTTIEKYFIIQRIEKIKELLEHDSLSLSEIADKLGYSSVAYLSSQFKKVTGFTPSYYKANKLPARKNLDAL